MAFTISEFRAAFPKGIARPNLWDASLSVVSKGLTEVPDFFTFRCEKAEIPGRTVATVDDIGSGPALKFPYEINYNDMEITIICGTDMTERYYFEQWIDSIVIPGSFEGNSQTSGLVRYYEDFARGNKLELRQIDEQGDTIIKYTLQDVYPLQIGPMNLSWEEVNTYQRFNVTLNYRYYEYQ